MVCFFVKSFLGKSSGKCKAAVFERYFGELLVYFKGIDYVLLYCVTKTALLKNWYCKKLQTFWGKISFCLKFSSLKFFLLVCKL